MLVTGITGKNPPFYGDENSHRTVETGFLSNLEMCGGFWNSIDSIDHDLSLIYWDDVEMLLVTPSHDGWHNPTVTIPNWGSPSPPRVPLLMVF